MKEGGSTVQCFFLSDPSPAVPKHREGGARWESMFYLTNVMHLALVWWTTALASNTRSE